MAIIYLYLLGFKTPVWPITIFGQSSVQPSEWFLILPSRITDQRQSSVFPTRLHKKCNSRDRLLPILIHWNTKNSDPDRSWFAWRCCRWRQNGSELYQRPWKERVPQKIGSRKIQTSSSLPNQHSSKNRCLDRNWIHSSLEMDLKISGWLVIIGC